LNLIDWKTLLS